MPDGERIPTWTQLYNLSEVPEELIVIGSGVTGAEFASAYNGLGSKVTLVSPATACFPARTGTPLACWKTSSSVAACASCPLPRLPQWERTEDGSGVIVTPLGRPQGLGHHCLVAIGSIPNTEDLGLDAAGVGTPRADTLRWTACPARA